MGSRNEDSNREGQKDDSNREGQKDVARRREWRSEAGGGLWEQNDSLMSGRPRDTDTKVVRILRVDEFQRTLCQISSPLIERKEILCTIEIG